MGMLIQKAILPFNHIQKFLNVQQLGLFPTYDTFQCSCEESLDAGRSNSTWCELHYNPHACWHQTMMNHMQIGDMVILLAQDKENLPQQNRQVTIQSYQLHGYIMLLKMIIITLTVSKNSVNLEKKYHQQSVAICSKTNSQYLIMLTTSKYCK